MFNGRGVLDSSFREPHSPFSNDIEGGLGRKNKMRLRAIVMPAVFTVSLAMNVWLVNGHLQDRYYAKGVKDGRVNLANAVVSEVEKTGRLTVTGKTGRKYPMQVVVLEAPPLPPKLPVDPNGK